jgi:hypothetical protein
LTALNAKICSQSRILRVDPQEVIQNLSGPDLGSIL